MTFDTRSLTSTSTAGGQFYSDSSRDRLSNSLAERSLNLSAKSSSSVTARATGDRTAPRATAVVANILGRRKIGSHLIRVTYTDAGGINLRSLGAADLLVQAVSGAAKGFKPIVKFIRARAATKAAKRVVATYSVTSPDKIWDSSENGSYTVSLGEKQVRDTSNNVAASKVLKRFRVSVPNPAPQAQYLGGDFSGAGEYTFQVKYTDNRGVSLPSISSGDIQVTGPVGLGVSLVSREQRKDGVYATYRLSKASGGFNNDDNGTYTLKVAPREVSDTLGKFVASGNLGTFDINSAAIPPIASLSGRRSILTGTETFRFTVSYSDNTGIKVSTLDNNDIRVTGPNGYDQLAEFIGVDTNSNGTPRTATYEIKPPDNVKWNGTDVGLYKVTLQAGQVGDLDDNSNSLARDLGNLTVGAQSTRIQAERMNLSGYRPETLLRGDLKGTRVIRLRDPLNPSEPTVGTAKRTFTGATGTYDVIIGYFDENDGKAQLSVKQDNILLDSWSLDQNLGSTTAVKATFLERRVASGITITNGDVFAIEGIFNGEEAARVDYIEFIRV